MYKTNTCINNEDRCRIAIELRGGKNRLLTDKTSTSSKYAVNLDLIL